MCLPPAAGQKGYAMALAAELIVDALIGPVVTEANWLLIMVDSSKPNMTRDFIFSLMYSEK